MEWSAPERAAPALRVAAPELSGYPLTVPESTVAKADPLWQSSSAMVGERFSRASAPAASSVGNFRI